MARKRKWEENLVKVLEEETMRTSGAAKVKVKRPGCNQHLEAKDMGCIVKARLRVVSARKSRPLDRLE